MRFEGGRKETGASSERTKETRTKTGINKNIKTTEKLSPSFSLPSLARHLKTLPLGPDDLGGETKHV